MDYSKKLLGIGKFDVASTWYGYSRYELQQYPSEPYYNYVGQVSQNIGTAAKWQSYSTVDWSNKGMDAFIGCSYVAGVTDVGPGGDNQTGFERIGAYAQYDAGLSYDFKGLHINGGLYGLKLTVGVNNAFNRSPPELPNLSA